MRRYLCIITLLFAVIVTPTVLKADITYIVNQTVATTGSMTGTITTDGNTGILGSTDIVGWNLTLNDGTNTLNLIPSDSYPAVYGNDLTASGTALYFNFSATDGGYFYIFAPTSPYGSFCDTSAVLNFCTNNLASTITINNINADNNYPYTVESGNTVIASVSPEPSTAILWLTGVGLMILTRKRIAHLLRPDPGTHGSLSPH